MKQNIKLYSFILCIFVWQNIILPITTDFTTPMDPKGVTAPKKIMSQTVNQKGIKLKIILRILLLYSQLLHRLGFN